MVLSELKKLFIKQHVLLLIIIISIVKVITSLNMFAPDYNGLSPEQQKKYLAYIDELGGKLDESKEEKIVLLYAEYQSAAEMLKQVHDKYVAGEYATSEEYFAAMREIPEIAEDAEAIEKLYAAYEKISENESGMLLASDAPIMSVGMEYPLMLLICYISAAAFYYERKMDPLSLTSVKGRSACAGRLFSLFCAVGLACVIFFITEFCALCAEIGTDSLFASVTSLESFGRSNYPDMNILTCFCLTHLLKFIGCLLTAATGAVIMRAGKNFAAAIFTPAAIHFVWAYLFSKKDIEFYSPYSLMQGGVFFQGDAEYRTHLAIPSGQTIALAAVSIVLITIACIYLTNSYKNRRMRIGGAAIITAAVMLLGGCSAASGGDEYANIAYDEAYGGGYYFKCQDILADAPVSDSFSATNEDDKYIIGTKIEQYDEFGKIVCDQINRELFTDGGSIQDISVCGGYLYYLFDDGNGSKIGRISLDDYSDDVIYSGGYYPDLTAYFDLFLSYESSDDMPPEPNNFIAAESGVIFHTSDENGEALYSLDPSSGRISYLLEDIMIPAYALAGGKLYYINSDGHLTLFSDNKKTNVCDGQYKAMCAYGGKLYLAGGQGLFCYEINSGTLEKISDITEIVDLRIANDVLKYKIYGTSQWEEVKHT